MDFFKLPHIPNVCSKGVIIDSRIGDNTLKELKKLGIRTILSYRSENLLLPIESHPDMTILHLGKKQFICSPDSYAYYKKEIPDADIICGKINLKSKYPYDIPYNITILNDKVFLNNTSDQIEILKMTNCSFKEILNVKQGYTKCNICIVNENAIITSDRNIYKTALEFDIDVLLIEPGFIELKGMSCGFIGGATGLIAPDVLAVNGEIKTHPSWEAIVGFCKNYGVNIISLKKGLIEDIGSILPIF